MVHLVIIWLVVMPQLQMSFAQVDQMRMICSFLTYRPYMTMWLCLMLTSRIMSLPFSRKKLPQCVWYFYCLWLALKTRQFLPNSILWEPWMFSFLLVLCFFLDFLGDSILIFTMTLRTSSYQCSSHPFQPWVEWWHWDYFFIMQLSPFWKITGIKKIT